MRFHGLDLNLLVALDALLTEQNVSIAATKIHLSQSAMSGALNRLREYFRDELLVPTGRRMVLTPRAEQLVLPVRRALLQIKNTITTRPEFDATQSERSFTLIASDYAIVVAVAEGLRAINRMAPRMRFQLTPVDHLAALRVERGEADLLITLEPYVSRDHPQALLFEDDYVVVAWTGNQQIGDALDEATYFALGHVGVELGAARTTVFDSWYLQSGKRTRRIEVVAPNFTMVPHLIVGTERVTTMHQRLATFFAATMPLRIYPPPFELPRVRQVIQWNRLNEADPATLWVRDQLVRALAPAGGPTT